MTSKHQNNMDIIDAWIAFKQHNEGRAERTAKKYRQIIERLAKWATAKEKEILELDIEILEEFAGLYAHTEGLSARTRRPMVAAIRGFYSWCAERGHIRENPAEKLGYPSAGRPLPIPLQLQNAQKLLNQPGMDTFKGVRDTAIIATLIGLGIRVSGLCALNRSSLIFYREGEKEHLVVRVKEKGGKERLVPAEDNTKLLLRAYLGHPEYKAIDKVLDNGDEVLFVSLRNRNLPPHEYRGEKRRISPKAVRKLIIEHGEAAGIPRAELRPHAARHLFGTELAEDDVNTLTMQALLGHADANSSAHYAHLAQRKLAKVLHRSSPMAKIRSPVSDLIKHINAKKRD